MYYTPRRDVTIQMKLLSAFFQSNADSENFSQKSNILKNIYR